MEAIRYCGTDEYTLSTLGAEGVCDVLSGLKRSQFTLVVLIRGFLRYHCYYSVEVLDLFFVLTLISKKTLMADIDDSISGGIHFI